MTLSVSVSLWVWLVLTVVVFALSSHSVHSCFQQGSTNTGPAPPGYTEPDIVVPETYFLLSQMEQTSHKQLQVSEKEQTKKIYEKKKKRALSLMHITFKIIQTALMGSTESQTLRKKTKQ